MAHAGLISTRESSKLAHRAREAELARIATEQHGAVALAQLVAIGFGASTIRSRVAAHRLRRVHRGVFVVAGVPLGSRSLWMAAVLACGPGAVLSHRAAAALWGFRESSATRTDVIVRTRAGRTRDGIFVHRGELLAAVETTTVARIPCTSVPRTVVDLAAMLSPSATEYAIHRAQTKRLLKREELSAVLERSPGRPGSGVVRRILGITDATEDDVKSGLERRFVRICRSAGLPTPRRNLWIALPEGHGLEVDFSWAAQRLVVEVDSRAYHDTDRAFHNDPRRDRLLMLAGWRVARFTGRDLDEQPRTVAAQVRRLLAH